MHGQQLWRDNNCQSCHQVYGFGGFLGPDLTNVGARLGQARLTAVLREGAGQMPGFEFSTQEIDALGNYFAALDATGVAQPVAPTDQPPAKVFETVVKTAMSHSSLDGDAYAGWQRVQGSACIGCHLPNWRSVYRAPDLSEVANRLDDGALHAALSGAQSGRGMPKVALASADRQQMVSFLRWLAENRGVVSDAYWQTQGRSLGDLIGAPWFEYK